MNSKDIRALQESYLSIYESQSLEEGLRAAVKRLLGGKKKEEETPEPESRGAYLRRRYNVGPERSDTSAKRQILDRSRARAERDQEKYGGSVYTKKVAQQSQDAHDRYLKAGYSKYGADLKHGRGNKAARRAATLQREDIEWIVDSLVNEGYDLSSYTWDDMYEICFEELNEGEKPLPYGRMMKKSDELSSSDDSKKQKRAAKIYLAANAPKGPKVKVRKEDIYNIVFSHLLDEGYADTEQAAVAIIECMSEEWVDSILEEKDEQKKWNKGQTLKDPRAQKIYDRMTQGVSPEDRTGPEGWLRNRAKSDKKPTTTNTSSSRQRRYADMTQGVSPEDRIGPEGYLRHRAKTGG